MTGPLTPRMRIRLLDQGSPMKLFKSPWECGISKWVEEVQRKQTGRGCPKENPKGHRSP